MFGPSFNNKFKGFLVQARNEDGQIVGRFETKDENVKLMDCDAIEHSTITHKNAELKQKIEATWISPLNSSMPESGVRFHYTIVEKYDTFWVNQRSPLLEYKSSQNGLRVPMMPIAFILLISLLLKTV